MLTSQTSRLSIILLIFLLIQQPVSAQMVSRTVVESAAAADLIAIPAPNQRGMFSDASGAKYLFAQKNVAGLDDCSITLFQSTDDGLSWTGLTQIPDIGIYICQEDVSAQLADDGCLLHAIWTMRESPTDEPYLGYGVYDLCSDNWIGVEPIRPGVIGFSPDVTLYNKGAQQLPIIGYTTEDPSGRDGWINFKRTQSTWLFAQTMDAYRSSFQDYFLGSSLHQKGSSMRLYGSLRAAAGLCPLQTQLFSRQFDRATFPFSPPEFFVHGYLSNFQSFYLDPGGNMWICYIAEKDAGCSPGQEIYTVRLPAVGVLVNIYGISDMETGPPFSTTIPGEDHYNFAITAIDGAPTVIFSRYADNYEIIYVSTFDGFDFGPPQVFYHQPGEQYLRFQTYKDNQDCLQFAASCSTSTGQETVYFADCGTALRTTSPQTGIARQDFLLTASGTLPFKADLAQREGIIEVLDLQGKLLQRFEGTFSNFHFQPDHSGLFFYRMRSSDGAVIQLGKVISK